MKTVKWKMMENLVAENLFATTSGIAGRTIARTRWSVSPMMETVIMLTHDDDHHHDNDEEGDHDRHYNDEEGIINKKTTSCLQETEFSEYNDIL